MKLLALDFDGVLHRASDAVLINFSPRMAPWQLEVALKAQSRFAWAPLLTNAIEHTDVSVVIHSTWRKRFSDATMKHFLPPEVASRVIVLDGQIEGRETMQGDDYLAAALDLIAPTSLCVLDDRPEFFSGGKVKNWIDHNHGTFVWCEPDIGLKDPAVVQQLIGWSRAEPTFHHTSTPTH